MADFVFVATEAFGFGLTQNCWGWVVKREIVLGGLDKLSGALAVAVLFFFFFFYPRRLKDQDRGGAVEPSPDCCGWGQNAGKGHSEGGAGGLRNVVSAFLAHLFGVGIFAGLPRCDDAAGRDDGFDSG